MKRKMVRAIRLVGPGLLFVILMAMNLHVGLSKKAGSGGLSLFGLSMQLSTPTAVASGEGPVWKTVTCTKTNGVLTQMDCKDAGSSWCQCP